MTEPAADAKETTRPKPILVADDNADDLLLLKRALHVTWVLSPNMDVHDGEEAIGYLEGTGEYRNREMFPIPILLLLDLKMPHKTGFDVLA